MTQMWAVPELAYRIFENLTCPALCAVSCALCAVRCALCAVRSSSSSSSLAPADFRSG